MLASDLRLFRDSPLHYERHRPEETTLYRLVQEHVEAFFAQLKQKPDRGYSVLLKMNSMPFLNVAF